MWLSSRLSLGTVLLVTFAIPSNGQEFYIAEPPSGVPVTSAGNYRCTFRNLWTPATHPNEFPGDATWSDQLYIIHSGAFALWQPEGLASGGVARLAQVCIYKNVFVELRS
jgi:Spondin_N